MIVIAAGPESNGTRLLQRILDTGTQAGKCVYHWPLPNNRAWWGPEHIGPAMLVAAITREPEAAARSAVAAGHSPDLAHARAVQSRAESILHRLAQERHLGVYFVRYEGLLEHPVGTVAGLDAWLRDHGYRGERLRLPEPIRDENAKWAAPAELAS